MSTVTVPQVNPNDEVTALSVNQGSNAIAAVVNGNIDDANVSTLSGSKITTGTLPAASLDTASNPITRDNEQIGNSVASGLIWSATTGLGGTMTSGVAYVNGIRLIVPTVASFTFTASRDTYIYIDNTGSVQYSPQTNGAAQPATPTNNMIITKVVTSASTVTSILDLRVLSPSSPWKTYTPTWTNLSVGNGTAAAQYSQIGKLVTCTVQFTYGSTSTITGSVTFTLPVTANARYSGTTVGRPIIGNAYIEDAGVLGYLGIIQAGSTTTAAILAQTANATYVNPSAVSTGTPFTWATGDFFSATFSYEAL